MNIRDIAALAGVSVSTVSKILNKKDADISEETRKRVLSVVKEYQYVPYSKVRDSVVKKTNVIGVVLSKEYQESKELAYYIEQFAKENGYSSIISYADEEYESLEKAIRILIQKKVEGFLVLSSNEIIDGIKSIVDVEAIPLVLLQNSNFPHIPSVFYSWEEIGFTATQCLIEAGHRNIGCILSHNKTGQNLGIEEGYIRALYMNDILMDKDKIFNANTTKEAGQIGVKTLLNRNVTAIVCENSEMAYCAYDALQKSGIQIPKDVSIICAMDSTLSELLNPPTTGIEIPLKEMGQEAVKILVESIESKKELSHSKIEFILHNRASVDKPPKGKSWQGHKIIVVGSMNMDFTIKVATIPTDGETILATSTHLLPGGKGANQAVGASKLGGLVYAIGCLGNDSEGKEIYNNLIKNSVKTEGVVFDRNNGTGKAYINVADNGESTIVVYPGANNNCDSQQINEFKRLFVDAKFCLVSMEIPMKTVESTISLCNKNNVKVILKPSTVKRIGDKILANTDYLVPNEKEIHSLVPHKDTLEEKAMYFYEKGVKNTIVTLGSRGCYLKNDEYSMYISSADFVPFDTTGAADAFISALAVSLSEGNDILSSISFATYSAGISITRQGVQPALPDRMTLEMYREEMNSLIDLNNERMNKHGKGLSSR